MTTSTDKAVRAFWIAASTAMVLLFAACLLWVVLQHAAFLREQQLTVSAQNAAINSMVQLNERLLKELDKATTDREEMTKNQMTIIKSLEYCNSQLRKLTMTGEDP